jgi:tRNA(Ile)-lysidine synthase
MTADKIIPQSNYNGSQEALGRALRRAFFKQIYTQQEADFIALAHQQEDQQETFFIRLMRGATLTGLTCMRPIDGIYIRPLLDIPKQEILDYLAQQKISYRIDPTNTSHDYLRNRIRLKVLPALNECDTRFAQKFNSTLTHLQQEDLFLAHLTQQTFNTVFSHTPQKNNPEKTPGLMGSCDFFRALHPVLQKRLVLYWLIQEQAFFMPSDGHLEEIIKFLASPEGGTHAIAPTWSIHKKHQIFWIEHNPIVAPANSPKSAT